MPQVTMTLEEFEALRSLITSERESEGAVEEAKIADKPKRKVSQYQKDVGRHMKALKKRKFRGNVMKAAHKLARKDKRSR